MITSRRLFVTLAAASFVLATPAKSIGSAPLKGSTVIIVRHGEKATGEGDVPLTSAGQERAQALARTLLDSGVTSIYTSQMKRAQDTASPLAQTLHVKAQTIPKGNIDEVVRQLRATRAGKTTVLVWHGDELPEIVNKLGGTLAQYGDQEYDRLVVLTLVNGRTVKVLTLRYGR